MSRSALWRQEGNRKVREQQADELFNMAVEEGRNNRSKGLVPTWGSDDSFHLNPMLLQNMIKSSYFQKCCRDITDWNTLVDEIYYQATHLEPWAVGSTRDPSTAFCLLLRLFTLRCTEKQMKLLLDHVDSPYIRGIGFLYLRYVCDPKEVWDWIEPYLYDEEPIRVTAQSAKQKQGSSNDTIGSYVRRLFTDRNYHGTMLPRLPIQIERDIQVKLLQAEKIEDRAQKHTSNRKTMSHFETIGSKVMALYGDEENPIQWYEGVVDRVISTDPETGYPLKRKKFIVTFPEYGNTETVSLGEMEMPGMASGVVEQQQPRDHGRGVGGRGEDNLVDNDRSMNNNNRRDDRGYRDHSRGYGGNSKDYDRGGGGRYDRNRDDQRGGGRDDYGGRGNGHGRGRGGTDDRRWERGYSNNNNVGARSLLSTSALPTEDDLYEEVRRRERETVTANNRKGVSRRPPTMKSQLGMASSQGRRHSASPDYSQPQASSRQQQQQQRSRSPTTRTSQSPPSHQETKKRSAEELAVIQEKKRKLMAKYG